MQLEVADANAGALRVLPVLQPDLILGERLRGGPEHKRANPERREPAKDMSNAPARCRP